jgi:hypothetical protein
VSSVVFAFVIFVFYPASMAWAQIGGSPSAITISSSTATGVGLASATIYKLTQGNKWSDYEDIVIIPTLNEVAKKAANERRPMTTADYDSIVAQVKALLDSKAPRNVVFATEAACLTYAIDSLSPLASSAQAGPLLPTAVWYLGRLKFNQLETSLDPNRQTPADLAPSAVASNAFAFIEKSVREANDLAHNDPQFSVSVNAVLQELTGFDTTSSFAAIQALYPNAIPSLPSANNDGSITLNPQDLVTKYQATLTGIQSVIDADLADIEAQPAVLAARLTPAVSRVTSRSALSNASTTGCTAGTTSPSGSVIISANDCTTNKNTSTPDYWSLAQGAINGLSTLVGFSDSKTAGEIKTVGNAAIQAGKAITQIDNLISSASSGITFSNLLGFVSPTTALVGAGVQIFQSLFGSGSSSPDTAVLQQIQKLSQQIARLQQDMDSRFNLVDAELNTILKTLNNNFALIDYQLGVLNGDAHAIQTTLLDVQAQINRLEQYLYAWTTALSKEQFIQTLNDCLDYRARTGMDIGFAQYQSCENAIYTWAVYTALDELWAGLQQPDYSDGNIYNTFLNFPLVVDVNYVNNFPAQNLGLPALDNARLPNFNEWTLGARAYLELAHEWPQYASQISSSRIDDLIRVGTTLSQAIENANSISNAGVITANQALFTALENKSGPAILSLQNSFQALVNQYISDPSLRLGWTPPGGSYTVTLNLWGGPGQNNTTYVPGAFSAASIPDCNGGAAWVMSPNVVSIVSPVVKNAEQLGLGTASICLSFSWYWAGTSVSNDPYAPGYAADYALESYQVQVKQAGGVVFAQTIYGYSITDPAHQILMCSGPARTGHSEIWSQAICTDEYDIAFAYYSLTTNPVGSSCQTLIGAVSGSSPLIWNLSPQFSQFVSQNSGLYVCAPGAPLANLFTGNSSQTIDPSAGLNSLSANITNTFAADQQTLYGDIAGALCAPGTGCSSSGPYAGRLVSAAQFLTGVKYLLQAYANFGLPRSVQSDNILHRILYGNQSILDGPVVLADFVNFSLNPITDVTDSKILDEISTANSRINALASAFATDLSNIQQNQTPESLVEVVVTLDDLRSFEALKSASALSACNFVLSPSYASVGSSGAVGAISVQELNGCRWTVSTNSTWLTTLLNASGTGNGTITYFVPPNTNACPRDAIFIIGDQIFKVLQAGTGSGSGSGCGGGGGGTGGNTPDFVMPSTVGSQTVTAGVSTSYSVSLSSLNGFTGAVSFAVTGLPNGASATFNPPTVGGGTGSTILNISTAETTLEGDYTLAITGTAGSISHYSEAHLVIQGDVSGSISSSSATISVGNSATFDLTLTSVAGLTDQFTFSCPNAPVSLACSFNPPTVTLPANGTVSTKLTVTVNAKPSGSAVSEWRFDWPNGRQFVVGQIILVFLLGLSALYLLHQARFSNHRRLASLTLVLVLGALAVGQISCGSAGSASSGPGSQPPAPTAANVTLSIQASSASVTKTIAKVHVTVP